MIEASESKEEEDSSCWQTTESRKQMAESSKSASVEFEPTYYPLKLMEKQLEQIKPRLDES